MSEVTEVPYECWAVAAIPFVVAVILIMVYRSLFAGSRSCENFWLDREKSDL